MLEPAVIALADLRFEKMSIHKRDWSKSVWGAINDSFFSAGKLFKINAKILSCGKWAKL